MGQSHTNADLRYWLMSSFDISVNIVHIKKEKIKETGCDNEFSNILCDLRYNNLREYAVLQRSKE